MLLACAGVSTPKKSSLQIIYRLFERITILIQYEQRAPLSAIPSQGRNPVEAVLIPGRQINSVSKTDTLSLPSASDSDFLSGRDTAVCQ